MTQAPLPFRRRTAAAFSHLAMFGLVAGAGAQSTTVVSLNPTTGLAAGGSDPVDISADGRYALFSSTAGGLDPSYPGAPPARQLWVRDLVIGVNELVSATPSAAYADLACDAGTISADGRFVVFEGAATNLVAGDTNGQRDIFVRDRLLGVTTRESVSSSGAQGDAWSGRPEVSDDGRYVVFESESDLFVPGDVGHTADYFVRDRTLATTALIAGHDAPPYAFAYRVGISGDGSTIVMTTNRQLLGADANEMIDVYCVDRASGSVTLESVGFGGSAEGGVLPDLSGDARFVLFASPSANLTVGDTNGVHDVFVRDRVTGTNVLVSRPTSGAPSNDSGLNPVFGVISRDGTRVAFQSRASNLIEGDLNGTAFDVFRHDIASGVTEIVTVDSNGQQTVNETDHSYLGAISGDGQRVLFGHRFGSFSPQDMNGLPDCLLRDFAVPTPSGFCFGTASACPCGNAGPVGYGCANHSGAFGARLSSYGTASVANDTLVLQAHLLTTGTPALFFQGDARVNGGFGAVFGDGLRCAGGSVQRLGVEFSGASTGYAAYGAPLGDAPVSVRGAVPAAGGTFHYQVWYRDVASWCTSSAFNLSSGWTITWLP